MAEKISIQIDALDNASGVINNMFTTLVRNATSGNVALAALSVALGTTVGFLASSSKAFLDYSEQVKNFARNTGASAEEASRIIQIGDDVRLSVESMSTSFKILSTHGITPSIESIKALSEQFLALQPGAERTSFLVDNFGRSGLEMGKLLERGAAGIDKLNSEVQKGLILDEAGIRKSDEYKMALDSLNDRWDALSVTVGGKVVPVLDAFLERLDAGIQGVSNFAEGYDKYQHVIERANEIYEKENTATKVNITWKEAQAKALQQLVDEQRKYSEAVDYGTEGMDRNSQVIEKSVEQLKAEAEALKEVTAANNGLLSLTMSLQSETDNYSESLAEATSKQQEAGAAVQEAIAKYGELSPKVAELRDKFNEASGAVDELKMKHQDAMNAIAYGLLTAKLQAGEFTDAEYNMAIAAGVALGQIDQATADLAIKLNDLATAQASGKITADQYAAQVAALTGTTTAASTATTGMNNVTTATAAAGTAATTTKTNIDGVTTSVTTAGDTGKTKMTDLQRTFTSFNTSSAVGQINNVTAALNAIPTDINVTVTETTVSETNTTTNPNANWATGTGGQFVSVPAGYPNDSYMVGLSSGEKYQVVAPNETSTVTDSGTLTAQSGQVINIYAPVTLVIESADSLLGAAR